MLGSTLGRSLRKLVLWDIDHTLIETRGVGRAIYERAFAASVGRPLTRLANVTGRTEFDIMRETLRLNTGEPTDANVRSLANALIQEYEDSRDVLASVGRVLPGARETLRVFAADKSIFQTVVSGNLQDVARIKLETFRLDQYLDLVSGAYGDNHDDRAALISLAQRRAAERTGESFDNSSTILIGDTCHDVRAALAAGVKVIAVATGKTSVDELMSAGAACVINSLWDVTLHVV